MIQKPHQKQACSIIMTTTISSAITEYLFWTFIVLSYLYTSFNLIIQATLWVGLIISISQLKETNKKKNQRSDKPNKNDFNSVMILTCSSLTPELKLNDGEEMEFWKNWC